MLPDTPPPAPAAPRYPLAIVGAGALGLHFAARLAKVGPVALIARSGARAAALRQGVTVRRTLRAGSLRPGRCPAADWAILLVKTGDTR